MRTIINKDGFTSETQNPVLKENSNDISTIEVNTIELVNQFGFSLGIYKDSNTILKLKDSGAIEVPICIENFTRKKWNFIENIWFEGATENEIIADNKLKRNEEIKAKYEFHKYNGWNAYQDFRAKIVSDIYDNRITEEQAFVVEKYLKVAYDRISQNGDWKTARFELLQVVDYPEFVKYYYDMAILFINNYIDLNYEN